MATVRPSAVSTMRRATFGGAVLLALVLSAASVVPLPAGVAATNLPQQLTDKEFWALSEAFSEDGGVFHSDNFVSNEGRFQTVIPDLVRRAPQAGFYIGVGPEQNFTYIAALKPRMAFIVDIRRGNLHEHLLYKALFEMAEDRADFLARLFSRERPAEIDASASPERLFAAIGARNASETLYRANFRAIVDWLTKKHELPLPQADIDGIEYVYRTAFFADGPDLNYQLTGQGQMFGRRGGSPTYAQLMAMEDGEGSQRSYLASEQNFRVVKDLETRNLLVPVVGDFGGPKALRAVGRYARENGATISAFYVSNVEQYLRQDGKWAAFCANVASMPLDEKSTFIRSVRGGTRGQVGGFGMFTSSLAGMQRETVACRSSAAASLTTR